MGQIYLKIVITLFGLNNSYFMALFRNQHEKRLLMTGYVIFATVEIERKMDKLIAEFVCGSIEKADILKQGLLFTERITFDAKKDLLLLIIKKGYSKFYKDHPEFTKLLSTIAPHRNIFAHLETEETAPELSFKKYVKGELTFRDYNMDKLAFLENDINTLSSLMDELIRETPPLS